MTSAFVGRDRDAAASTSQMAENRTPVPDDSGAGFDLHARLGGEA